MNAIVINRFGSADDVFETIELNRPEPGPEQVLVRVMATSVNPADYGIRSGALAGFAPAFPAVLHGDVAGVVEEVGERVTSFQAGQRVFGFAGGIAGSPGALADYVAVDYRLLAPIPPSVSFATAGALPLVGITAYLGIVARGQVQAGQDVLIYGGTGGVGHIALQIARLLGAQVYATVANEQQAQVARRLGATDVIFYRQETAEQFTNRLTGGKGFAVVFDTVGNQNLVNSLQAAAVHGVVVTTGAFVSLDLSPLVYKGLDLKAISMFLPLLTGQGREQYSQLLHQLAEWLAGGKLTVLLDEERHSFAEVGAAHRRAESGQATGKVAIVKEEAVN